MQREFMPPPRAAETSELIRHRLHEIRNSGGTRETVTVEWNEQLLHVEVIDLPLSSLYYNPGTHRIRAQRSHDPVRDNGIDSDPWSADSQHYLGFLLQAEPAKPGQRDPDFDTLKSSLEQYGQNDPGLATHHGVLVNGNSRAAALREIGILSMRVGVLPESFTWAEINAVELSLQLRKDHRRDYSYVNRLIAMEEQASLGRSPAAIAKEFRIKEATYHQERWILNTIWDLIARSSQLGGLPLRLVDFEDHQEKLKELQRLYVKLASTDRDQAEVLKETRLAAILLGFAKTDVRHIDEDFLRKRSLESLLPQVVRHGAPGGESASIVIPGLGVSVPAASSAVSAARALNDTVLRAVATVRGANSEFSDSAQDEARGVYDEAREVFSGVIDAAERDARIRKRRQLAPARLADACADIDQSVVELVQARTSRTLDEEALDEAVLRLRDSLRKLAQQAARGTDKPGEGVVWLIAAVAIEGA